MRPLGIAVLVVLASACGKPKLSGLRCQSNCQTVEDPFRLLLAVDFTDSDGNLSQGQLTLKVDEQSTATKLPIADLFKAAGLQPGATSGTLQFSADVVLQTIQAEQTFAVSATATDASGKDSNTSKLTFSISI